MKEQYAWLDPLNLPKNNDLLVVLVDDRRGFLGWLIKAHESGNYNHAMFLVREGFFASQSNYFKEVPITEYMKPGIFLKFWRIKNLTGEESIVIHDFIKKQLKRRPWYDLVGLFGQIVPFLHWIQIPGLYFCSEIIAAALRLCSRFKQWMTARPSPSDLDKLFKPNPSDMDVVGYWWSD